MHIAEQKDRRVYGSTPSCIYGFTPSFIKALYRAKPIYGIILLRVYGLFILQPLAAGSVNTLLAPARIQFHAQHKYRFGQLPWQRA
jgi:hypothetical protein